MKRLAGSLAAAAVVVMAMFIPAIGFSSGGTTETEYARITDYNAKFVVDKDGTLHATEKLAVNLPIGRHGIFRFFDVADPNDSHVRLVPEDIKVTRDGQPDGLDLSTQNGRRYIVARIGQPDVYVNGDHTYVISYTVKGVLSKSGSGSQFYWNLIPGGWRMPIEKSTLTATLPAAPASPKCAIGVDSNAGCTASVSGDTLKVTTGTLEPNTPVTVQTTISTKAPGQHTVPWTVRFDPVFSRSLPVLVFFLLLALVGAAVGWLLGRSVIEPAPAYPLMYAPPEGLGPAQGAYLLTERVTDDMYAATMLQLGQDGVATLEHKDKKDGWTITGTSDDWGKVDAVTHDVATALGISSGVSFTAQKGDVSGGKKMQTARSAFGGSVKRWAKSNGLIESKALPYLGALGVIGAVAIMGLCYVLNPFGMSAVGLPFGLFAVFGLPLLSTGATTFRTRSGRDLWSRIGGFRRVLATPSSEQRFDFSGRKELYTAYIPWAVAFGCADVWAQKYRVEMAEDPPVPNYFLGGYYGASAGSMGSMSDFSDSFSSSMHSAISAYAATQSSSSGGGGGGFSGGGGGGGGGGGSW